MNGPHVCLIGNVNVDMIMGPQAPWPEPGTEVVLPDYELRVGGQAANSAFALEALGVPFLLLANAGHDILGRWLRESFGESATDWPSTERPTTVSVGITHPNGERTFFTNEGHLEAFGPADILPRVPERAPDGSVALLVAAFLSPLVIEAFPDILAACKRANYAIALDTGWPPQGWTDQARAGFSRWLPATDILLINESEGRALSGLQDLSAAAARIRGMMPDDATLVIKRGPEGAQAWQGGDTAHVPSPPVVVADSIGAGDIFNAGFLAARLAGRDLRKCVHAGVHLASAVIATRPRSFQVDLGEVSGSA
jgi:sugar/nucleoside kinase (ribokinase family)